MSCLRFIQKVPRNLALTSRPRTFYLEYSSDGMRPPYCARAPAGLASFSPVPRLPRHGYCTTSTGMKSVLQLLLFLKKLISFSRKRWGQLTRPLWYTLVFARSRILSRSPKKRDGLRRGVEHRPAEPPTTVIQCASQFPPPRPTADPWRRRRYLPDLHLGPKP